VSISNRQKKSTVKLQFNVCYNLRFQNKAE